MQDPKSISQKIARTRLERIRRLPMALWRILEARMGRTSLRKAVAQGAHTQRTVGPNVSHPALGTAASGAVTPRKIGAQQKRGRCAEPAASQSGKSAKNSNLTGRGPGQGFSFQNQMSSGSELSDAYSWLRYVPNRLRH